MTIRRSALIVLVIWVSFVLGMALWLRHRAEMADMPMMQRASTDEFQNGDVLAIKEKAGWKYYRLSHQGTSWEEIHEIHPQEVKR